MQRLGTLGQGGGVMSLEPANHFVINGNGISGIVDTAGMTGQPVVSLSLHGQPLEALSLENSSFGLVASATVEAIPDSHTVLLHVVIPVVNVEAEPVQFASLAVMVNTRTSIGGQGLVQGAIQQYEFRPISGVASAVQA
jgi:hypothetical protein